MVPVVRLLEAPGDDVLGVDADERVGAGDRLSVAADLDRSRRPWVDAGQVVDDDRGATAAFDVAELLGRLDVAAGDVDRVQLLVMQPAGRHDVGCSVSPDRRDPAELAFAVQIGELSVVEKPTHWRSSSPAAYASK